MKALLSILLLTVNLCAATPVPPPEILGIRLGMAYPQAHSRLTQIGQFKNRDEGQEVWTLRSDPHYHVLIVGFDRERRVRYVTVLANPKGEAVDYSDLGDVRTATSSGGLGNLVFTWKSKDQKKHIDYLAIARGSDPHRLLSYSVKRLGVKTEDPDQEKERTSKKPRR
jgi:hypothetical protein